MKKTQNDVEDWEKLPSQQEIEEMIDKFVAEYTTTDSIEASTKNYKFIVDKIIDGRHPFDID